MSQTIVVWDESKLMHARNSVIAAVVFLMMVVSIVSSNVAYENSGALMVRLAAVGFAISSIIAMVYATSFETRGDSPIQIE